jgi:NADPH:quinone reductase-like Zn-dependent oxidoreductase
MKAILWTSYGSPDVLQFADVDKPTPKNDEVLIKIRSTTVNSGDCRLRGFDVPIGFWIPTRIAFGIRKPRYAIPGMNFSGEIVSAGEDAKLFDKGDNIFGTTGMRLGSHAEYISLSEKSALVKKPDSLNHEEAVAVIFGGLTAIHFLRDKAKIRRGQNILVNGASGAVGTASIQLAKHYGTDVTGVCSAANFELVQSLGADQVIDYTQEDFTKNAEVYDVILDTVGNLTLSLCRKSLTPQGRLVLINTGLLTTLLSLGSRTVICGVAAESKEALAFLGELAEAGAMKPVIDRVYPLQQTAEAHRYVERGHKKGNVVITV